MSEETKKRERREERKKIEPLMMFTYAVLTCLEVEKASCHPAQHVRVCSYVYVCMYVYVS